MEEDVCLVQMPYGPLEHPSIALGVLHASLRGAGISSRVLYANLQFADQVGLEVYAALTSVPSDSLLGEWTFSGAAFPGFSPDHRRFLEVNREALGGSETNAALRIVQRLERRDARSGPAEIVARVRALAPGFVEKVARQILDSGARIVGCTSTFQQHCPSIALLRRIHELDPDVVTMIGGANCEGPMGWAAHRLFPWIDFVASGEADLVFADLCRRILEDGRWIPLGEIPHGIFGPGHRLAGHSTFGGDGCGIPRAVVRDMDRVPVPDYDDYFVALRESQVGRYVEPGLLVETSRGCWWGEKSHCTFCGLNGTGMVYRSKSPGRVIGEFAELASRYGLRRFEVVDNILDTGYFDTVLPRMAELDEPYYTFFETKANLNRRQMELLAGAGVRWIQPGIESLHPEILRLIAKGTTPWINLQLLRWAHELGIRVEWLFLYGVPGEKDEWYAQMAAWLPAIAHLQPPTGAIRIQFDRFSPYQQRPERYGLRLSVNEAYLGVYPVTEREAWDLAYFFEDYHDTRRGVIDLEGDRTPGLRDWRIAVREWRLAWMRARPGSGVRPPELLLRRDGPAVVVVDTRACAVEAEHELDPLAAAVIAACDTARTAQGLARAASEIAGRDLVWESLRPVVTDLLARRILLDLGGRLVSLPVAEGSPKPPHDFPGGRLLVSRCIEDRLAAMQLGSVTRELEASTVQVGES